MLLPITTTIAACMEKAPYEKELMWFGVVQRRAEEGTRAAEVGLGCVVFLHLSAEVTQIRGRSRSRA